MNACKSLEKELETVFSRIARSRMRDVPVLNSQLQVQAVNFSAWNGHYLGVMITPWFMNLMLLPGEDDHWQAIAFGEKLIHVFPSGAYEFTMGYEEGIGYYQMCSLFSPMFDFADQAAAVATAEAVTEALMEQENQDTVSTRAREIKRIWKGEKTMDEDMEQVAEEESSPADPAPVSRLDLEQRLEQPISRRNLLRAGFLRPD